MKFSKRFMLATSVTALFVIASPSTGWSSERNLDAHEHGVSTLKMAQEGNTVSLELEAPGEDIVGFEHEPKDDAEKASVKAALEKLGMPDTLFLMPASAACSVTKTEAEFETEKDHAGFHVKWSLNCEATSSATSMQIGFFDAFPNAKEIEVEAVGAAGQLAVEVEKGTTSVDLSKAFGS